MKQKRLIKGILCGVLAASLTSMGMLPVSQPQAAYAAEAKVLAGTYQNVVESFDWGPGVTKLILHLDSPVSGDLQGNLDKSLFTVETSKAGYGEKYEKVTVTEKREVTGVYTCDEKGERSAGASSYLAIEMSVSPSSGSPFFYDIKTSLNDWSTPYEHKITMTKDLVSGTDTFNELKVTEAENPRMLVQAGAFQKDSFTYGTGEDAKTLQYAYYDSQTAAEKKGLVIWLHGTGEGGTDPLIALLGNKAANLAGKQAQELLNADILVAQCPSRWLTYQTGPDKDDVNTPDKYNSEYTQVLKKLIENYVSTHPDIDKNRICIGGASNGGSMTMNMILDNPEYFAAAYFASEGYADRYITDEQIEAVKDIPMWFVYAEGDTTNDPAKTTKATYDRLKAAGAADVHLSCYQEGVVDKSGNYKKDDGTPHTYNSHWSWIYLLNNDCMDNETSIFAWLGTREKSEAADEPAGDSSKTETVKPAKVTGVKAAAKNNGKIQVTWTKQKDVKGYAVYVSKDKNFRTIEKKAVSKASTNSKVLTGCKKGTVYYIRVRAYNKSSDGKTVYGAYSKTVKIKAV